MSTTLVKEKLLANVGKTLGSADLGRELGGAEVGKDASFGVTGATFAVGAGALVDVEAFNSPDDKDADGVVDAGGGPDGGVLGLAEGPLLKYRLRARVKGSAGASHPFLVAEGDAEIVAVLADYHRHDAAESVVDAVAKDAGKLRLAVSAGDVLELGANEAVSMQVRGRLAAEVKVSWADVLSSYLDGVGAVLRTGTRIAIRTSLGATAVGRVSLADDFRVVFRRLADGTLRASVHKASARAVAAGVRLGLTVEIANPETVKAVLDGLIQQEAGTTIERIDDLLSAVPPKKLTEGEWTLVLAALDKLGVRDLEKRVDRVKEEWDGLKSKLAEAIEAAARTKIEAGFRYEYQRTRAQSGVLEMALADDGAVRALHHRLIRGDLVEAVRWAADPANAGKATVITFLGHDVTKVERAIGFSLGIGKWTVGGTDVTGLERVVDMCKGPGLRVAYLGKRSYTGVIGKQRCEWRADFKADMSAFAAAPTVNDLDLGLSLLFRHAAAEFKEDQVRRAIDEAIVWGVLGETDEEDVVKAVKKEAGKQPVAARIEMRVENDALRALLPALARGEKGPFAAALGRAMPWDPKFLVRSLVHLREQAYAGLWLAYLESPHLARELAALTARAHLAKLSFAKNIAVFEGMWPAKMISFAEMLRLNEDTHKAWESFREGAARLQRALDDRKPHDEVREVFDRMKRLWAQSHHVLALGAMLVALAERLQLGPRAVARTLTFEIGGATGGELTFGTA